MKKILSVLLLLALTAALFCSCSAPIIYPEELAATQWLKERTEGYTKMDKDIRWLFRDQDGFQVYLATSSYDNSPTLEIEYDPVTEVIKEKGLITIYGNGASYGTVYNTNCVFDPYANDYHHSMQVYQKDEKNYRIFFWFYNKTTDFYPIPKLLTEEQYQQMLTIINAYNDEQYALSQEEGNKPTNYAGAFLDAYKATYTSDLATNPDGTVFYEYTPLSDELLKKHNGSFNTFLWAFHDQFQKMNLSNQNWRTSFESLGYKDFKPVYQILYFDLSVGTSFTELNLKTSDIYFSPALQDTGILFRYDFCPELAKQPYMRVTQS